MTQTQGIQTIVAFKVYERDNYSRTASQRMLYRQYPATMAGLAAALDRAQIQDIEQRGYSGLGAGAWVEAAFGDNEDDNILITSLDQPELKDCAPLEAGASRLALARRAGQLERERVWDGHNHVSCDAYYTRQLMASLTD